MATKITTTFHKFSFAGKVQCQMWITYNQRVGIATGLDRAIQRQHASCANMQN